MQHPRPQVMDPVRSRCLCVRVAAPSLEVVQEQLYAVAKKENLQVCAGSVKCAGRGGGWGRVQHSWQSDGGAGAALRGRQEGEPAGGQRGVCGARGWGGWQSEGCRNLRGLESANRRAQCPRGRAAPSFVYRPGLSHVSRQLPGGLAARIAAGSNRDLRRALLSLEVCRVQSYPLRDDQPVHPADWEAYIGVRPRVCACWGRVAGSTRKLLSSSSSRSTFQGPC